MENLQDALVEELRDLLNAENQLTKALPKMAKACDSKELSTAIKNHLQETREQVVRLEKMIKSLGKPVRGKTCEAMKGLLKEGEETIKEHDAGPMRDAMIIAAAQKVEHYEIASYGTVVAWAEQLGNEEVAQLAGETLDEEKGADEKLTEIARSINPQSMAA